VRRLFIGINGIERRAAGSLAPVAAAIRDRPPTTAGFVLELDRTAPLRDVWYYAVPGARLRRGRTLAKTILGEPLLIGRDRAGQRRDDPACCQHRPCSGRADGPGARTLRSHRVVVALAPLGARQGQGVRAVAVRVHDGAPRAVDEFERLPDPGRPARDRD